MMKKRYFYSLYILLIPFLSATAQEMMNAARTGDAVQIRNLLERDVSLVHVRDADKNTPLHLAIDEGHLEAAVLLLDRGADIEAVNYKSETPLHIAAHDGNAAAVKLLLNHGADLTKREMRHRIPLYLATNWGRDLETVRLLIDAGSDVNDTNQNGESVLISTLYYGKKEIIDLLLDRGAVIPDDEETLRRVLYITASNGMERPFNIARTKCEEQNLEWWTGVPMHACARGGSVEIAEALMDKGAGIMDKNRYGIEPIHIAAENGRINLVKYFLSNGALIDTPSRTGKTALHMARENGHRELVDFLVEAGVSQEPPVFPVLKGEYLDQEQPGGIPLRFAPGIVSTHDFNSQHSPCVFSPDLNEVYWTDKFRGPILMMTRREGVWSSPEEAPFNSEYGDGEPVFSPDGKKLYFLSSRPLRPGGPADKENMWIVERTGDGWSEPEPVSERINAFDLHWSFSMTNDGTIYFASPSGDSYGHNDIYRSRRVNGEYTVPENLGPVINTSGVDHTPYIASDESYLIYVSRGESSTRRWRFCISYRNADGSWMQPVVLSDEINAIEYGLCPSITPDRRFMFFIGDGDIFWVDAGFIEDLRPEKRR